MHRLVEPVCRPTTDAKFLIRRDVGRIKRAERGWHWPAPGKKLAARLGMAGDAIARASQILTALDTVSLRVRPRHRAGDDYRKGYREEIATHGATPMARCRTEAAWSTSRVAQATDP